jgi:hypothetical protein
VGKVGHKIYLVETAQSATPTLLAIANSLLGCL